MDVAAEACAARARRSAPCPRRPRRARRAGGSRPDRAASISTAGRSRATRAATRRSRERAPPRLGQRAAGAAVPPAARRARARARRRTASASAAVAAAAPAQPRREEARVEGVAGAGRVDHVDGAAPAPALTRRPARRARPSAPSLTTTSGAAGAPRARPARLDVRRPSRPAEAQRLLLVGNRMSTRAAHRRSAQRSRGSQPVSTEAVAPAARAALDQPGRAASAACRNGEATWTWRARCSRCVRTSSASSAASAPARSASPGRRRAPAHAHAGREPGATCTRRRPRRARGSASRVKPPEASSPTTRDHRQVRGRAGPRRRRDRGRAAEHQVRVLDELLTLTEARHDVAAAQHEVGVDVADDEQVAAGSAAQTGAAARRRGRRAARRRPRDRVEVERRGGVGVEQGGVVDVLAAALERRPHGQLDDVQERPVERGAAAAAARRPRVGRTPVRSTTHGTSTQRRRAGCRSGPSLRTLP